MTTSIQNRQPKGIPVGGQFAASARAESDVALASSITAPCGCMTEDPGDGYGERVITHSMRCPEHPEYDEDPYAAARVEAADRLEGQVADQARWGDISHVRVGSRTPWGEAQSAEHVIPGVVSVSTAGHGGLKLSPERNAGIPAPLRNRSGWYEEDSESNIVAMYYPEAFRYWHGGNADQVRADATEKIKDWYPDEYMKITGETLRPEDSLELLRRSVKQSKEDFRAENAEEFVSLGNGDTPSRLSNRWIPDGFAVTRARKDATGEERHFLVQQEEVIHDHRWGQQILIDPNRHLDVTDIVRTQPAERFPHHRPQVAPITGDDLGIDYSGLTDNQAERARAELDKRWRFRDDDGTEVVESLGEHFARRGVVGKHPHYQDGKGSYSVAFEGSRVMTVSKAAYDALTGVPDTSTETDRARIAYLRAEDTFQRERAKLDFTPKGREKRDKAEATYRQAQAEHRRLSDADDEAARRWQAERDQMQAAAMQALLVERGIEI